MEKVHKTTTFLLVTCQNIYRFKIAFTDRFSNKPVWISLLTTPPHLKYVDTIPGNLSLTACFLALMFHKVVWQHRQGVVGFLLTSLLQIYHGIFQWKNICKSVRIWHSYGHEFVASLFGPPCMIILADVGHHRPWFGTSLLHTARCVM